MDLQHELHQLLFDLLCKYFHMVLYTFNVWLKVSLLCFFLSTKGSLVKDPQSKVFYGSERSTSRQQSVQLAELWLLTDGMKLINPLMKDPSQVNM